MGPASENLHKSGRTQNEHIMSEMRSRADHQGRGVGLRVRILWLDHQGDSAVNVSLPGMERTTAQRLVEAAHQVCPYSRATHGNTAVETTLV